METILGIDLGTTNSEVAVIKDGKPFVIPIGDELLLPSCVAVNDNGELIVGRTAKNQMVLNAESTILSIKRKMGRDIKVKLKDREFSPEEISSFILLELKKRAEEYLGYPVKKAVITVPAFFNDDQRKATRDAGELAGLDVLRIINEPTAASLAYETSHKKNQKLLVYDLGGGTFDVSVVVIENDVVEVKSSYGDTQLGGDDFDQLLLDFAANKFYEKNKINLLSDLTAKNRLRRAVELAKCELSDNPFAVLREEYIYNDLHLEIELSRAEFEDLIRPLLEKTIGCIHQAITDSGIITADLDHIILVGGSTRIPLVSSMLKEETKSEPVSAINPELIVAMGAAIQAGTIAGEKTQSVLVDITPHTFGISVIGEVDGFPTTDMYVPIIKRNTPIPVQKAELFYTAYDKQEQIEVEVYEGENRFASQNNLIGKFLVKGLSRVEEGNEIVCKLSLDLNGILEVTAYEKRTGLSKTVSIQVSSGRGIFDISKAKTNIESFTGNDSLTEDQNENSKLTGEAENLKKRALTLMDSIEQTDADELGNLLEKSGTAIRDNSFEELSQLNDSISDMLFYLED